MIKIYHSELLVQYRPVEVLWPLINNVSRGDRWSDRAFDYLQTPLFEVVEDPLAADFFLAPHNYNYLRNEPEYMNKLVDLAKEYNKKIILFYPGDRAEPVLWPQTIVFRQSQYKSRLRSNEIIMPGYVEDLGRYKEFIPRTKEERPVVGFCGWAALPNFKAELRFIIKIILQRVGEMVGKRVIPERQGLWFRRRALAVLEKSRLIKASFIIRKSYSGNEKTIALDKDIARAEYIDSIYESDLTLAIKGDGNFSTRFYEVLSLGRIPLFIDTDCVLPLEDVLKYDEFIIRISHSDLDRIDTIVADRLSKISAEEFMLMQKRAKEAFDRYLRVDQFLRYYFEPGRIKKYDE